MTLFNLVPRGLPYNDTEMEGEWYKQEKGLDIPGNSLQNQEEAKK